MRSRHLDSATYKKFGGTRAIINEHVANLLQQIIPLRQQGLMVRIFEALKTQDDTKIFRRLQELRADLHVRSERRLESALQKLTDLGVLRHEQRRGDDWYEFKHDYLVPEISKWIQARRESVNQRRLLYAITPGVFLFLGLLTYLIIQYNTFYAGLTNKDYAQQHEEIFVARRFDPFGEKITTGILIDNVRNLEAINALRDKFTISSWEKNNWDGVSLQLHPCR